MNYSQIYESPYPKMIELTLKDLLKDGIKSARIRSNDRQIIEVLEKDKALAEIKIKDYQNILLSLINTPSDKIYGADDEKKFLSEFVNRASTKKFNFKGRLLKLVLISSVYISSAFAYFLTGNRDYTWWTLWIVLLTFLSLAKTLRHEPLLTLFNKKKAISLFNVCIVIYWSFFLLITLHILKNKEWSLNYSLLHYFSFFIWLGSFLYLVRLFISSRKDAEL